MNNITGYATSAAAKFGGWAGKMELVKEARSGWNVMNPEPRAKPDHHAKPCGKVVSRRPEACRGGRGNRIPQNDPGANSTIGPRRRVTAAAQYLITPAIKYSQTERLV